MTVVARSLIGIVASTSILALMAVVAVRYQMPWLAPSIGSAVFTQCLTPHARSARPWPIAAGQVAGAVAGVVGVLLAGAGSLPPFTGAHALLSGRVLAVLIAVPIGAALQIGLRARTPAGGATALVVAFGLETADMAGVLRVLAAIAVSTLLGESVRSVLMRLEDRDPGP